MTTGPVRILYIGVFKKKSDEGLSQISQRLFTYFALNGNAMSLNTSDVLRISSVKKVVKFEPHIIHYTSGPTLRSFLILFFLKLICLGKPTTIASATRPYFSVFSRVFVRYLKPDLVLSQSTRWENFFREKKIKVFFLPNGVDLHKFKPVDEKEKIELRNKYKIPYDKFILLHVGHIKKNRNLEIFATISKNSSIQCVIVGGTSLSIDPDLKKQLISAGCIVISEYIENVHEIYQLADCYVFCVCDRSEGDFPRSYLEIGAVDTPLSVLEAMACNLPVITTCFGTLPRMFSEGDGFSYYDGSLKNLLEKIELTRTVKNIRTRQMVTNYSWENIFERLGKVYQSFQS